MLLENDNVDKTRKAEFREKVINEITSIAAKISDVLETNGFAKLGSLETLDDSIKAQLFESLHSHFKHLKS